jgi:outer membrane protein assembly factor BamA
MKTLRKRHFRSAWLVAQATAWLAGAMACQLPASPPAFGQQPPQQATPLQTNDAKPENGRIEGRLITRIRVVDETGKSAEERIPPLPLVAGKPFDFAVERETLRKLYAMGDFSDIHVTTVNQADGVEVNFIVKNNYYNNVIHIYGLREPPNEAAALAALRLNLGEPFRESLLREAVGRLEDTLHSDGLYLAKVTYSLGPHEESRQMDVTINIDPGPRARVGNITLSNQTPYTNQQIIKRSKLSIKNEVTSARLSRAAERVKQYLVGQG